MKPFCWRFSTRIVALAAILGMVAIPSARAAVSAPGARSATASPNSRSHVNYLLGVSAVSSTDAWAVGYSVNTNTYAGRTLILHWDGMAWSKVKSPNPGSDFNTLDGVSAVSSTDAWAVGSQQTGPSDRTLVLHWDGMAWSKVSSPSPGPYSKLVGVSAVSSTDAWAVGLTGGSPLVLHWDGMAWSRVAVPNGGDFLAGVSAVSSKSAWAVGTASRTLVLRWDGTAWSKVKTPRVGVGIDLEDVSAVSSKDAWAIGYYATKTGAYRTLALHWDGTAWSKVKAPNVGSYDNGLSGVSAVSSTDAWAVGGYGYENKAGTYRTLALHWDGTAWSKVKTPNVGSYDNGLSGVSAVSSTDAWAVGIHDTKTGAARTLILHWDGTAWSKVKTP
jgi:hypothetical protein